MALPARHPRLRTLGRSHAGGVVSATGGVPG
jgi:hypothetical protein